MAVISATPLMDINALIASDDVNEGDVLLLENGIYFQTVNINKSNIRIAAKGPGVIFDGKGILLTAFTLSNVIGVAIEGIKIRHYREDSIIIQSGSGNTILYNIFNNMLSDAIVLIGSSGNLIWKNEIYNCSDGIKLTSGSTNNWVIENTVKDGFVDAFETSTSSDSNNAFISNTAIRNRSSGFRIFGSNNLLLNNISINNTQGILITEGSNSVAIGNKIKDSKSTALLVFNEFRNYFAGVNSIECSDREGMFILGNFGMCLNNDLSYNRDTGITFEIFTLGNLVMGNKLVCNIPDNIVSRDTENNFINNMDKPCKLCESPSDACDGCSNHKLAETSNK